MDWDDDDEQTTVYDKGGSEDAARALLHGSGPPPAPRPAAGAPPPPGSMPAQRPAAPPPTRPGNRMPVPGASAGPPVTSMPAMPAIRPAGRSKAQVALIAAVVVAAAAALFLFLWPRTGSLVVTVSGPGSKPLDAVEIFLNGEKKCSSSPCRISGLSADTYMLRARAAGYQPMADTAVAVNAGEQAVHNLSLVRAVGTGVKVIGEGVGLQLSVDGTEIGPLPQELKDMEPGEHLIKVSGGERYEPFEKRVKVEAEQMQTIGPVKLKVLKGLATIKPGDNARDARVLLVSGNDRRTIRKLPIKLDIPTEKTHTLVARKKGYAEFRKLITFEDGKAEKTFIINLEESRSTSSGRSSSRSSRSSRSSSHRSSSSSSSRHSTPSGSATLNINSIPVSKIILDGRPLGPTPKVGIRVSPGPHTVVFIQGASRKSASVNVPAGATKTVAVRF